MPEKRKKYTTEERKKYIREKQKETQNSLNTIYSIATEYTTNPEHLVEYLQYSNSMYQYSPRNQLLIQRQLPGASLVQSQTRWEEKGYHILPEFKGKGAFIIRPIMRTMYMDENGNWIPLKGSGKKKLEEYKQGKLTTKEEFHYWQQTASAYDITMTDCPPQDYPQLFYWGEKRLSDSIMIDVLTEFAEQELGVSISKKPLIGVHGVYSPYINLIELDVRNGDTQQASTLAHEIGHAIQYRTSTGASSKSVALKEVEADCYSILICNRLGLEIPEGRKQHLSDFYKKYIQEQIAAGKYNPDTDTTGDKNPFFRIMDKVKKTYEIYAESLDELVSLQQGNIVYANQFVEQAKAVYLMSETSQEPESVLSSWENQFAAQIDKLQDSLSFKEWFSAASAAYSPSPEDIHLPEYLEQLKTETSEILQGQFSPAATDFFGMTAFVLQLKETKENELYHFRSYDESRPVTGNQYDFLFAYDVASEPADSELNRLTLAENVFVALNGEYRPSEFIGHSLSVSDVVVLCDEVDKKLYPYYCDKFGFTPLPDNFLTASMQAKLFNRFTVAEEIKAYQSLSESGFDVSAFGERANYLNREYQPRILASEQAVDVSTVTVSPENVFVSRFSYNNIPYLVFIDENDNVYLGNPEQISGDVRLTYDNKDGSLIHVGTGKEVMNLYRNDVAFDDTVRENKKYEEALNVYASVQSEGVLSSLTETTPLVFGNKPTEPIEGEAIEDKPTEEESTPPTPSQSELNRQIAIRLDSIIYDLDSIAYREKFGVSVMERQNNIRELIQDIELGEMPYSAILEVLQTEHEEFPAEAAADIDRAIQYTKTALELYGDSHVGQNEQDHMEASPSADETSVSAVENGFEYIIGAVGTRERNFRPGEHSQHGNQTVYNDIASALSGFANQPLPRTFEMRILSEDVDIPDAPFLIGRNDTIDIDSFMEQIQQAVSSQKEIPDMEKELDFLAETVQQQFDGKLLLKDTRHEPRDFRLEDKVAELLADGKIPAQMEKMITNHKELIQRRLTSIDKNNEFFTESAKNSAVFENDTLYLTAIERTLNADKALHPVSCAQISFGKLQWTPWYEPPVSKLEIRISNETVSYYVKKSEWNNGTDNTSLLEDDMPTFRMALEKYVDRKEPGFTYTIGMKLTNHEKEIACESDCFVIDTDSNSNQQYVLNLNTLNSQKEFADSATVQQEIRNIKNIVSVLSAEYKQLKDTKIVPVLKKPYVRVQWSEHPDFTENEILSLKDAQKKFARLDMETAEKEDSVGYYKTKFSLYLPNDEVISDRYDLGDGYGGLVEFLDKSWSFGLDYRLEHGELTEKEYDTQTKEKNALVKNLWNDIDIQYAEMYIEDNRPDLANERIHRIDGRNKWFKEHGQAGELNFQSVPKITEGKSNPIKAAANKFVNSILSRPNVLPEQTQDTELG